MKISGETLSILKSMTTINTAIVVFPGSMLRTVDVEGTMFAEASVQETFPKEFAFYDIRQFLSVVGLFEDPDFEFGDKFVTIKDQKTNSELRYLYSQKAVIAHPDKDQTIEMDDPEIEFDLSSTDLDRAVKAGSVMDLPTLTFTVKDGKGTLKVHDKKNPDSNKFEVALNNVKASIDADIDFSGLKIVSDDYHVSISSQGISCFEGRIKYYLAPEATTKVGE